MKSCIPQLQPEYSNFRLPQQNLNQPPRTGWHYERCFIYNYPACEVTITNIIYRQILSSSLQNSDPIKRADGPRKRRKIDHHTLSSNAAAEPPSFPRGSGSRKVEFKSDEIRNGESIAQLRKMVMGKLEFTKMQQQYVALTVYH